MLPGSSATRLGGGWVEIDGARVCALVQSYNTQSGEPEFEVHRKYLEIPYVAAGAHAHALGLDTAGVAAFNIDAGCATTFSRYDLTG